MDGRSTTLLIAVALAATGLAGCIENPNWLNADDLEVSAAEHRALADAAAESWSAGAELVGIMAIETGEQVDPRIATDPQVGNGLAPAWWYVYCATDETEVEAEAEEADATGGAGEEEKAATASSMVRAFKVTADGTVSSEDDAAQMAAGYDHDMAEALGAWELDSAAALETALGNESFRAAAQGMNATLIEGLARHEDVTSWYFAAASASGLVVATVDAVTGELLEVKPIDFSFAMPTFEMAARDPSEWVQEPVLLEGEGVVAPREKPLEVPFSATGPMYGTLTLELVSGSMTDSLAWWIANDEGEAEGGSVDGFFDDNEYVVEVEIPEAGDYTLAFAHLSGVFFLPLDSPTSEPIEFTYVLDLQPGHGEGEHEDDHSR